jgi:hypothetical protein
MDTRSGEGGSGGSKPNPWSTRRSSASRAGSTTNPHPGMDSRTSAATAGRAASSFWRAGSRTRNARRLSNWQVRRASNHSCTTRRTEGGGSIASSSSGNSSPRIGCAAASRTGSRASRYRLTRPTDSRMETASSQRRMGGGDIGARYTRRSAVAVADLSGRGRSAPGGPICAMLPESVRASRRPRAMACRRPEGRLEPLRLRVLRILGRPASSPMPWMASVTRQVSARHLFPPGPALPEGAMQPPLPHLVGQDQRGWPGPGADRDGIPGGCRGRGAVPDRTGRRASGPGIRPGPPPRIPTGGRRTRGAWVDRGG